jgi:hypothetical protein
LADRRRDDPIALATDLKGAEAGPATGARLYHRPADERLD